MNYLRKKIFSRQHAFLSKIASRARTNKMKDLSQNQQIRLIFLAREILKQRNFDCDSWKALSDLQSLIAQSVHGANDITENALNMRIIGISSSIGNDIKILCEPRFNWNYSYAVASLDFFDAPPTIKDFFTEFQDLAHSLERHARETGSNGFMQIERRRIF